MKAKFINEYSNSWVKTDKGGAALLAYEEKVLNFLLQWMGEDEAFAAMDIPFAQELTAQAAQRRKDPERHAKRLMHMAQEDWTRNANH